MARDAKKLATPHATMIAIGAEIGEVSFAWTSSDVLLYHLALQSQRVEIRAVNARDEEFLVARTDLAERNPTNDLTPPGQTTGPGFFVYTWDGKAVFENAKNGTVNRRGLPNGTYRLRLVVTKALAEVGNPAHTEIWTSPTMNLKGNPNA